MEKREKKGRKVQEKRVLEKKVQVALEKVVLLELEEVPLVLVQQEQQVVRLVVKNSLTRMLKKSSLCFSA